MFWNEKIMFVRFVGSVVGLALASTLVTQPANAEVMHESGKRPSVAIATIASHYSTLNPASAEWLPVETTKSHADSGVQALAPFVEYSAAGFRITDGHADVVTLDADTLSHITRGIEETNALIAAGEYVMMSDGGARPHAHVDRSVNVYSHGYVSREWYGLHAHLDAFLTSKIIEVGIAASALAAILGVSAPVAGAIALAVSALKFCSDENGELDLYWVGTLPPLGGAVCNPF